METRVKGNPLPYPRFGDDAAKTKWIEEDERLVAAEMAPQAKAVAAAGKSDSFDLPMSAAAVRKALATIDPEDRETYLMRTLVRSSEVGGLSADAIVAAQEAFYGDQVSDLMRDNFELQEQLRNERAARNHAEKEVIDSIANRLFDYVNELVPREVKDRVASMQARVLAKAGQIKNEDAAIVQLNAKAVLLEGRVGYLESINPIFVTLNSGQ